MGKGQNFEREFCKLFSLWLSGGKEDDHFWRTSGSGARATVRARKGKQTVNHVGDVAPVTDFAQKFLGNGIIELKTGYRYLSITDLFRSSGMLANWIIRLNKLTTDWMLVHRNRQTLVFMSPDFATRFIDFRILPYVTLRNHILSEQVIYVVNFSDLITYCKPNI